ncbi:MAG: threonylcarbamoyl-AMP synthase [Bacteroidetes bacterium]|nr:MAG: threonylcarbamoyl-AMP synthase [Bacteroidota bacterium]
MVRIYEDTPGGEGMERAVMVLREGGVIIYPTDTLYAVGCALDNARGAERIMQIKGLKRKSDRLTFLCDSISMVADYARVSNANYRLLRETLPGPFTIILPGMNRVPNHCLSRRKTVGVRIPDNSIARGLVEALGMPLVTGSLPVEEGEPEYGVYPELMEERWGMLVDLVVDGGEGGVVPSTVVDATVEPAVVIREGKGDLPL